LKKLQYFLTFWLIFALSLAPYASAQTSSPRTLTLLFTNDTHNRLDPFQHTELGNSVGGVIRRARYFEQVRKQNPMTLILDAGDVFQGTPYYNFYLGEPDIKVMNYLGYDAMTVGNHELDNGMENLKKQTQYAHFPLLNANIVDEKTGLLVFRPFHIFNVHGLKVAVLGLMSEHAWQAVASTNKVGYRLLNPFETAQKLVPELRQRADLVISLHHMGISDDEIYPQKVADVDVIIGGHSHTLMKEAKLIKNKNQNGIGGTLVQHAFHQGVYVGRMDLELNVHNQITHYHSQLTLLDPSFDHEPIQDTLTSYGGKLKDAMGEIIGEATENMGVEGKFDGPFALGSLMADMIRDSQAAEVGIMNTGGIRTALPKGPITVGGIYEIMPFDNQVVAFQLSGQELKKIVETHASRLGDSKNLQFSGLVYTLRGKTVTDIHINGQKLEAKRLYRIAAPDYVFAGNEDISFAAASEVNNTGQLIRDVMLAYVRHQKKISPSSDQRLIRLDAK